MKQIKGIIPPMVTPLLDDDKLDTAGIERLVEHIIAGGVHGIFILGTTGEAQSLSYKSRYELVELVGKQVAGRIPLIVGITDTSLDESVKLAEKAAACGADGVVSAPPYYFAASQAELIETFTALADRVPLPLYLYNMPVHVKVVFEPLTVKTLAAHPNIVGLKDSSANMSYFQRVGYALREYPEFMLYVGSEDLTAECILMGAAGAVNGGANMFPELHVAMYNAAVRRDFDEIARLQERILSIFSLIYSVGQYGSSSLKGIKCALSLMGICNDHLPYPFRKFEAAERNKIRAGLETLGVEIKG